MICFFELRNADDPTQRLILLRVRAELTLSFPPNLSQLISDHASESRGWIQ